MNKFFIIQFLVASLCGVSCINCNNKPPQISQSEDSLTDHVILDSVKNDSNEEIRNDSIEKVRNDSMYIADFIKRHNNRTHLVYKKIELNNDLKQFFIDSIISYARENNYSSNEYTISLRAARGYLLKDNVFFGSTSIYLEQNDYYSDGKNGNFESVPYYSEIDSFKCFFDYPTFRQFGKETSDSLIREITTFHTPKKLSIMNHRWSYKILISQEGTITFIKSSEKDIDYNSTQLFYECINNVVINGYND